MSSLLEFLGPKTFVDSILTAFFCMHVEEGVTRSKRRCVLEKKQPYSGDEWCSGPDTEDDEVKPHPTTQRQSKITNISFAVLWKSISPLSMFRFFFSWQFSRVTNTNQANPTLNELSSVSLAAPRLHVFISGIPELVQHEVGYESSKINMANPKEFKNIRITMSGKGWQAIFEAFGLWPWGWFPIQYKCRKLGTVVSLHRSGWEGNSFFT